MTDRYNIVYRSIIKTTDIVLQMAHRSTIPWIFPLPFVLILPSYLSAYYPQSSMLRATTLTQIHIRRMRLSWPMQVNISEHLVPEKYYCSLHPLNWRWEQQRQSIQRADFRPQYCYYTIHRV